PAETRGAAIDRYILYRSTDGITYTPQTSTTATTADVGCPLPAGTCTYQVATQTGVGTSQASSPTGPITVQGLPDPPAHLQATVPGTALTPPRHQPAAHRPSTYAYRISVFDGSGYTGPAHTPLTNYAVPCRPTGTGCTYRVTANSPVGEGPPFSIET